jgi:hypothetical protein
MHDQIRFGGNQRLALRLLKEAGVHDTLAQLCKDLGVARPCLLAVAEALAECGATLPDETWWREYYRFTGIHWVLTEEGWIPGALRQPEEAVLDEINAPKDDVGAPTREAVRS